MAFIIFGKPLVFWMGFVTLASFLFQIYSGYKTAHGHPEFFKYHKINIVILCCLLLAHVTLGLLLYL